MPTGKYIPLCGPSAPVTGLFTTLQGPYLPAGGCEVFDNFRVVRGYVVMRWGTASITPAYPLLSGTYTRGGEAEVIQDGTTKIFTALRQTGTSDVYVSTDDGANFSKITAASGPYGSTKLNQLADYQTTWALVRDPARAGVTSYDCLIIQSGNDKPFVYAKMAETGGYSVGTYGVAKISAVDAPPTPTVKASMGTYLDLASPTYTNSNVANFNGGGVEFMAYVANTTVVSGDTVTCNVGAPYITDLSSAKMIVFYIEDNYGGVRATGLFNKCKIELGDNSGHWWTAIPAGSAAALAAYVAVTDGNSVRYQVGVTPNTNITFNYNQVRYVRVTYEGGTLAAASDFAIYTVCKSGTVVGQTFFGASYMGSDFRTIGPMTVASTPTPSTLTTTTVVGVVFNVTWIFSYLFPWDYTITYTKMSTTQRDLGVNKVLLFVQQDTTSDLYYYAGVTNNECTYTAGAWAYDTGSSTRTFSFTSANVIDYTTIAPPGDAIPLPGASGGGYTPMTVANGRLFLGNSFRFYYSRYLNPFQWTYLVDTADSNSSGSFSTPGEFIWSLKSISSVLSNAEALGSPQTGSASVLFWTSQNMNLISGWDSTSLNKRQIVCDFGTESPASVAISRHGVYWFTNERQVYFWDGSQAAPMTWNIVDSVLDGISTSRIPYVASAVANAAFYLSFTPSGGSANTKLLVWDETSTVWSTDTPPSSLAYDGLLAYRKSGSTVLYCFTPSLTATAPRIYKHDLHGQTTDLGSNIVGSITFREIDGDGSVSVSVKEIRVTCTIATGGTITTSRTIRDGLTAQTSTGSLSLTGNTSDGTALRIVRSDVGLGYPGVLGDAVSCSFTVNATAQWALLYALVDVDYTGPDRADS